MLWHTLEWTKIVALESIKKINMNIIPIIIETLKELITDVILPISPIIILFIAYDIAEYKNGSKL